MADTKQFNALPLLSVKSGLDSSLSQIGADLEQYFSAGWSGNDNLQRANDELHRAVGVMQMLDLKGLAVFCKEFETVLQEMLAQHQEPTNLHRDTLRGAMLALTQYLDALADGASNTALRLFYSYQELHQLRGLESAFEVDLFFPELGVDLPPEVLNIPLVPASLATVKKARAQYQRALLKWLRQDNPQQSLQTMRSAVQTVMACAEDKQREFWWIATGLLDSLIHDGLPAELNANKLLARIDLQMKSMAENKTRDSAYNIAHSMQYMVARSDPVSDTVDKIKQTYDLATYLPETQPLSHGQAAQILEQMAERLSEAQELLEQCAAGDADCAKQFADKLDNLHQLSENLDRNTLQFLCKQMHAAVAEHSDTDMLQRIRMEMAMAMMLLGIGIDRYQRLDSEFHEQVKIVAHFLQEGMPSEYDDPAPLHNLTAFHCRMEEQDVLAPLAGEMKANLQQVELSLNLFFSDASKREELEPLRRLLTQVHGGLYILDQDIACKLIAPVQMAIDRYTHGANPTPAEMHAIASAVSSLENFVHGLSQGLKPEQSLLEEVYKGIESNSWQTDQVAVVHEPAMPSGVAVREGGEDDELLEVFLEEAHEVLETLNEHLQVCQRNPHSRDALVIIRRGFHTLKGSGRMVGLTNLGEVAWAVEKALNKWLQDEKPAVPAVLEMIGDAEVLFQHWVEKLRSGDSAMIDATALVAAAQRIENGQIEEARPVVEESAVVEVPDIVIGGVSLSPVLFGIATDEAGTIIETLLRLVAALRKEAQPVITYDFVRAAHTLSGINRSTGFTDISDLAGALESWLQELLDDVTVLDILQVNLVEQTINALAEMVNTLRSKQEPKPRPDLITRLQLKKKQLSKSDSPRTEAKKPELSLDDMVPSAMPDFAEPMPAVEMQMPEMNIAPDLSDLAPQDQVAPDIEFTLPQFEAPQFETHVDDKPAIDEEMDLVAYVQSVTSENAGEPLQLQWQSPSAAEIHSADNPRSAQALPEPDLQMPAVPDFMTLDLAALEAAEKAQMEAVLPEVGAAAPGFNFNFDALDLAPAVPEVAETKISHASEPPDMPMAAPDFLSALSVVEAPSAAVEPGLSQPEPEAQAFVPAVEIATPARSKAVVDEEDAEEAADQKKRNIQDDLDDQLLPIFLEEADELYPQLVDELNQLRDNAQNPGESLKVARKLQRSLHTLKGSARMAGAMRLGELTHRVEDCLDAAVAEGRSDLALLEELENYFDRIGNALDKLRRGESSEEAAEKPAPVASVVAAPVPAATASATAAVPAEQVPMTRAAVKPAPDAVAEVSEERRESAVLRVRSDMVDDLVNEAGEISVARSRIEVELNAFKAGLLDLSGSVQGLRKLVREIEIYAESQMQARTQVTGESAEKFDPLEFDRFTRFQELTRFMNESVHDVQTVQQALLKNLDETSAAMSAQSKLNSVLQQSLMSIRMLPFSSTSQRLYRIVRQTAKELGKKVNLELYGTETELDRGVLEKMTAPFEHLLRNAIVHGLENPEERAAKGKPAIGNISLSLRQEGNEIVFELKDDGAGLNTVKIRNKAVEQGLLKADEYISDDKVMLLIFETGLSTASELTEIAGRGVGMNVVLSEIKALGGRIEVASEKDKGTSFTIYLPLTLAVMKALMVRAGNDIYALPSVMVEQVMQVKPDDLIELYRNGHADWQGKQYPLHYLPRLLGDNERTPESKPYNPVILLRSGEQRMAMHLDELHGNKEVVVKNVGEQLSRLSGITGATVQADGKVVLILNPIPLAQRGLHTTKFSGTKAETIRRIPVVMIVDDSLTVRKITTRLLSRVGYEVMTAKDGVDALEQLVEFMPDVMLLDVEMPRMDGFELTKHLRRDVKTRDLPIIMITSRTAEKHKNYALELGVNDYMGKPYSDEELLASIASFAPLHEAAPAV